MSEQEFHTGGCYCGALRYRVEGAPMMVAYCHCDDCRRSGGSVVSTFAGFRADRLEITAGEPSNFEDGKGVTRRFCGACGSPLSYQNAGYADYVYLHLGSFDDPAAFPPDRHVWVKERLPWHRIDDDLSQYDELSKTGQPGGAPTYARPGDD